MLDIPNKRFVQDISATSMKNNETNSKKQLGCTSLAWSKNSLHLYSGWTDNTVRVYRIEDAVTKE